MPIIDPAERALHKSLKASFGQDLDGVVSYGRRWDPGTKSDTLRVVVDDASTPDSRIRKLPARIQGMPVKVSRAGPAEF